VQKSNWAKRSKPIELLGSALGLAPPARKIVCAKVI